MKVEYGPPGHKGVTQIMGLGATPKTVSLLPKNRGGQVAGFLGLATYAAGMLIGSNFAKNVGLGAIGAVIVSQAISAQNAEAPPATPAAIQGWG